MSGSATNLISGPATGCISTDRPPHEYVADDPNAEALELTGRDYLSYSAISTYQRCPLRYYFAYVAALEPEFKASSLIFGGAIHAAIEDHYRANLEGCEAPELDALVAVFDEAWKSDANSTIRFGKTETAESLRDLAARMLAAFQASDASRIDGTLLGIEEEFRRSIAPDCPDLLGRLDLLTNENGGLNVIDMKTSRSKWSVSKVEEAAPQMLLYAALLNPVAAALGNRPVKLTWIVFTKTKSPAVERHTLEPDAARLRWAVDMVRQTWRAISARAFYPSPSSANCTMCPYRTACRQWEEDV